MRDFHVVEVHDSRGSYDWDASFWRLVKAVGRDAYAVDQVRHVHRRRVCPFTVCPFTGSVDDAAWMPWTAVQHLARLNAEVRVPDVETHDAQLRRVWAWVREQRAPPADDACTLWAIGDGDWEGADQRRPCTEW